MQYGITIVIEGADAHKPPPVYFSAQGALRAAMKKMKPGQRFTWAGTQQHIYIAAKSEGIKVRSKKLGDGRFRIWKTENREVSNPPSNAKGTIKNPKRWSAKPALELRGGRRVVLHRLVRTRV